MRVTINAKQRPFHKIKQGGAAIAASIYAFAPGINAVAQCGVPPIIKAGVNAPQPPAESVERNSVLPSSLVYYLHTQNYLQPEWEQKAIAWPLLDMAKQDGLEINEQFYWAQLNFMSLKAKEAYELFGEMRERSDWYGWMARQRQAIMDTRAFDNYERLEESVAYERKNFPFEPAFASITGFGERSLCTHWAETSEHERAVNLALKTLTATPRDAAYGTLYLTGSCFESFVETGRTKEAIELAQSIHGDLEKSLEARLKKQTNHPAYDPALFDNIVENRWYGRSILAPENYITYQLQDMVDWYAEFLPCKRDNLESKCSK